MSTQQIVHAGTQPLAQPTQRVDQHPAAVYLGSLSKGSRPTMENALDTIADLLGYPDWRECPWQDIRFQHAALIRSELQNEYAASTVNKILSALRGTLKNAWKLGHVDAETYHKAASVENVKAETPDQAAGRHVSFGEFQALMTACMSDETPAGFRDAALIALGMRGGLRRAEISGLDLEDFDFTTNTLTVTGKRNKTRTVPIDNGALDALLDWLDVRGEDPGPLFLQIRKGGNVTKSRLTPHAINYIIDQRCEAANVEPFTPHDMRRTYIGDLLDSGADMSTVQKLAGHANANTTASYDRRGERAKREAVKTLHTPYQRRRLVA